MVDKVDRTLKINWIQDIGACNLHSWFGPQYGCCYTSDHRNPQCTWNKPYVSLHPPLITRHFWHSGAERLGQEAGLRDLRGHQQRPHPARGGARALAVLAWSLGPHHPILRDLGQPQDCGLRLGQVPGPLLVCYKGAMNWAWKHSCKQHFFFVFCPCSLLQFIKIFILQFNNQVRFFFPFHFQWM